MYSFKTEILVLLIITVIVTPKTSSGHQQNTIKFSEPLVAVPCSNHGDLEINGDDTSVRSGQSVTCTSTGGEVHISNFFVEDGGIFTVSALEHSHAQENQQHTQWADTSCTSGILGSSDCNVCADKVQEQFDDLFGAQAIQSESFWKLNQKGRYPPSNNRPKDVFSPATILVGRHVQGFVKTDSGTYAGTYSTKNRVGNDNKGAIFFINYDAVNDRLRLNGLHEAGTDHPSGMSVLGKYVIFADDSKNTALGRDLRVIPTHHATTTSSMRLFIENWSINGGDLRFDAGGGVGMVKLNSGGYLLITTSPGGPIFKLVPPENPPKKTDFFYVEGKQHPVNTGRAKFASEVGENAYLDMTTKHIGRWVQDNFGAKAKQSKYQYSENLTVIPECGTGDIYLIHSSSTKPWAALQDKQPGYWRLSKVIWKSSGPELDILSVHEDDQSFGGCLHRAAATGWVNPDHQLELYCSEYKLNRKEDDMHFKIRAVGSEAAL